MKLRYTFETVDMGEEIIMVPVGRNADQVHGVIKINATGLEIVNLLKEETNEGKIVDVLSSKYENDRESLRHHVQSVLETLRLNDLIVE